MPKMLILPDVKSEFFIWNTDANVGLNSPNKTLDVELVQFGYFAFSKVDQKFPALNAIFSTVNPGAVYTGSQDDPLTLSILAHQKSRGGTQDGHVSPLHGHLEIGMWLTTARIRSS